MFLSAQPKRVSLGFSFLFFHRTSYVSKRRELSRRPINLFRITGRPSLLACDCRTQVTFFDQSKRALSLFLCLPRGCKSELGDPSTGFSLRPVIRLRPRPLFSRERRFTCKRDVKFIPCDNSRWNTPRAYVLRCAKESTSATREWKFGWSDEER